MVRCGVFSPRASPPLLCRVVCAPTSRSVVLCKAVSACSCCLRCCRKSSGAIALWVPAAVEVHPLLSAISSSSSSTSDSQTGTNRGVCTGVLSPSVSSSESGRLAVAEHFRKQLHHLQREPPLVAVPLWRLVKTAFLRVATVCRVVRGAFHKSHSTS